MSRGAKWGLIIGGLCVAAAVVCVVVFFSFFNKNVYQVVAVQHTDYQVSDFQGSELKFYQNGTFHLQIVYGDHQTYFLGIGTYTKQNGSYTLTFTQAIGRENDNLTNQMTKFAAPLVCPKSGSRIKFVDHNNQVYYFG